MTMQRLARRSDAAHGELRIVLPHGADAGHHRARARAKAVPVGARRLAGDPLALAAGERGAAVEARRHLHPHPRAAARHPRNEAGVELARLALHEPDLDRDAGLAQPRRAVRGVRIGVGHRGDDARDAGGNQRLGARRRAARVVARLERDVGRRAARIAAARLRVDQRVDLGVRFAGARMESFADRLAVLTSTQPTRGLGVAVYEAARGERERARHERAVGVGKSRSWPERRDAAAFAGVSAS